MLGGLGGRPAVERHQRSRNAGDTNDVSAPPIPIDRPSFDQVGASSNELFEPMDSWCHSWETKPQMFVGKGLILRAAARASSEANHEGSCTSLDPEVSLSCLSKKIPRVDISTGNSPIIHRFSTLDP